MKGRCAALLVFIVSALTMCCGQGSPSTPSSTAPPSSAPTTTTTIPPNVTIAIVGSSGAQAFAPNPAAVAVGQTVSFRNDSGRTHRVIADDGSWDAGTIAAGATSVPTNVNTAATIRFHCTIHASMVGSIN